MAVIGCGYWGPNLVRNFAQIQDCELVAICDRIPERLERIGRRYPGVRRTTDVDELFRDDGIDAVSICTPVHTHSEIATRALEAGKHVLLEKPLTDSVARARALIELADARNLVLMVDHTFVYSGAVRKIKTIMESDLFGDPLYFDSVRVNLGLFQTDINVVWDLAPHDLSIMDHVLGREPRWVSAVGSTHFGEYENLAYLTMMFDESLIAHVHVNWLAPVKLRSTLIGGSQRMIVYDDLAPSEKVLVYDKGVAAASSTESRHKWLIDYRQGDMHAPYIEKTEPLGEVCSEFLASIRTGRAPLTDGRAGLRVVKVLEAAQRSIESQGERILLDTL